MKNLLKMAAKQILPPMVVDCLRRRDPHIDEVAVIAKLSRGTIGQMVDVGAHIGTSTQQFVKIGWSVVAYEPDDANRAQFEMKIGKASGLQLSRSAVSNVEKKGVPLFSSDISSGISGLSAFHKSHVQTSTVDTVTLDLDLKRRGIKSVDFLKIDIEGFDLFALQGFDWNLRPRFVLYEFENRKTLPLGYDLRNSAHFMSSRGYHLLYSVWEPIVEYGRSHTWRGIYDVQPLDVDACWGNVLCFSELQDREHALKVDMRRCS